MTKNILIIGGSGFLGTAIVRSMQDNKFNISLLNRGTNLIAGTRQLMADRNNKDEMLSVAKSIDDSGDRFDAIIDLCCYNRQQAKLAWSSLNHLTDLWIYISSTAVYLEGDVAPDEESPTGGAKIWGDYGVGKFEAEAFYKAEVENSDDHRFISLRPPYIYGPGNDSDRETFIWSRLMTQRSILIPGDGKALLQFIHVEEIADIILLAEATKSSEKISIYNVASTDPITMNEWIAVLSKICQKPNTGLLLGDSVNYSAREHFPFRNYNCWLNSDKIKDELGWKPKYDIISGFTHTFKTYSIEALKENLINSKTRDVEDHIIAQLKNTGVK